MACNWRLNSTDSLESKHGLRERTFCKIWPGSNMRMGWNHSERYECPLNCSNSLILRPVINSNNTIPNAYTSTLYVRFPASRYSGARYLVYVRLPLIRIKTMMSHILINAKARKIPWTSYDAIFSIYIPFWVPSSKPKISHLNE